MKRIICVIADAGGAHRAVAVAIGEAMCSLYPNRFFYKIVDIYREGDMFCSLLVRSYPYLVRHCPEVYNFIYRITDNPHIWKLIYSFSISLLMKAKMTRLIKEERPDLILSVFALSSRIMADTLRDLKLSGKVPIVIVVVDPFTIHSSWFEPRADLIIVPTQEAKFQLMEYGLKGDNIRIIGFPINARFNDRKPKELIRKELGLKDKFTVMVMGGGDGAGDIYGITESLTKLGMDIQLLAIAGRNGRLLRRLEKLRANIHVRIFGYTDRVPELMGASDVLITKAGPGTLMEAISKELPMIIAGRTLGQEAGNVEFVRSKRLGWIASDRQKVIEYIMELAEHVDKLNEIRANICNIKQPGGAPEIARLISDIAVEL